MKRIFLTACLLVGTSALAFCQSLGNAHYDHLDYVSADGVSLHVPDPAFIVYPDPEPEEEKVEVLQTTRTRYVAVLGVTQNASSAGSAENELRNRLNRFYQQIGYAGISRKSIKEEFLGLHPTYDIEVIQNGSHTVTNKKMTGFEMKKSIRITFSDYNQLEQILVKAADANFYQLEQVEHIVERISG